MRRVVVAGAVQPSHTQLARGRDATARLLKLFPELAQCKEVLHKVVDEGQNAPPDGQRDGSLTEQQWTNLRDTKDALSRLLLCLLFKV